MKKIKVAVCIIVVGVIVAAIWGLQKGIGFHGDENKPVTIGFSKESGTYKEAFDLELSCSDPDAEIYYTMDGSDPTEEGNEARIRLDAKDQIRIDSRKGDANVLAAIDPILFDGVNVKANKKETDFVSTIKPPSDEAVDKCSVIRAAAKQKDGEYTPVATQTYFIGNMSEHIEGIKESCQAAGKDLAVISLTMDQTDLFDYERGIYVKGAVFEEDLQNYLKENETIGWNAVEVSRSLDANYKEKGREWERPVHMDYFESDGDKTTCELQQDCGIRIQGNYSRSDYQKSFRLYARKEYGGNNFDYPFWEDAKDIDGEVVDQYKKIVLRNGGNCAFTTKFSDAYWQSMLEDVDCGYLNARPCVVYLNGEYWGVYLLQDDFCNDYFEDKYHVKKEDVILYKGDAEKYDIGYKLDEGTLPADTKNEGYYFQEIEEFMKSYDSLKDQEDYDAFCKLVDPDSALDYFAIEVWINNKWDWPGKNWSMWKTASVDEENPYADGRWRYLLYDVEFGGVSGYEDTVANTVENSNLLATGTDASGSENHDKPNVRCFALLMTNPGFQEKFCDRLKEFSEGMFEYDHTLEVADRFKEVYQPILQQFFDRFPTKWGDDSMTADYAINGKSEYDTYGTWINIVRFIQGEEGHSRKEEVDKIIKWIKKQK